MEFVRIETVCGAPLYFSHLPHIQSVASGILVHAGTRDENWPKEAGLAHAFEHMAFQGNEKFLTNNDVTQYLEDVGGICNAWTGKEMTFFYNKMPARHFDRAIKYLFHLLTTPVLREENIRTEMQNIVQEIKMYDDQPSSLVGFIFDEVAYGNHPLSKRQIGTIEAVSSFCREDFRRYHERFYHPNNFAFIVVGNVKEETVLQTFNEFFSKADGRVKNIRSKTAQINRGERIKVLPKDIEQVHACLGALIGPADTRETMALRRFATMIGGGMSFPLFQEVRDKRGLCYTVQTSLDLASDCGTFWVYVGTEPARTQEAIRVISDIIAKNASNEDLFRRAKQLVLGRTETKFEDAADILDSAAHDIAFGGKPRSLKTIIEEIEGIELSEVTNAAERYLKPENFVYAYVAPKDFKL